MEELIELVTGMLCSGPLIAATSVPALCRSILCLFAGGRSVVFISRSQPPETLLLCLAERLTWHFFPPSSYLLQGRFYFWLDAAHLHQSLKYPRLLGYGTGGRDGFSCCSAYCPNPSTPPLQKILILLSALCEHNAAPIREHIKGIWKLMQLVFWLKTNFLLFCLTFFFFFLGQLNQAFVQMPVIRSQTAIQGLTRIAVSSDFCVPKCFWCVACWKKKPGIYLMCFCVQQKSRPGILPPVWGQPWHQTPKPRAVPHPSAAEGGGHQAPEDQAAGVWEQSPGQVSMRTVEADFCFRRSDC